MISISLSLKRLINNISRYPFQPCTYIYVTLPPPILTSRKSADTRTNARPSVLCVNERGVRQIGRYIRSSFPYQSAKQETLPFQELNGIRRSRSVQYFISFFIYFFAEKAKQERATPHLSREPSTQQAFLFSFFFYFFVLFSVRFFLDHIQNHTHNITNNTECYSPQQVFCNDYVTVTRSNRIPHNRLRDLHIPTIVYAFAKRPIGMLIRFFFSDVIDLRCI